MDTKVLDRFKDYVRHNYNNHDMNSFVICSNIHCSRASLHRAVSRKHNYSSMRYVEYIRVLKAMEFMSEGMRKVYLDVGYNSSSVFSKAFLRVTGFNAYCFYADELTDYKGIIPVVYDIATQDPKEAIEFITNNNSIQSILLDKQRQKFNVHLN